MSDQVTEQEVKDKLKVAGVTDSLDIKSCLDVFRFFGFIKED